jgi:hypothetical protein
MGKYDALADYLLAQKRDEVPMTFEQIERIIGDQLPASHQYRAWWSNNSFNSVMTKAWLDAGFRSEQVDMSERKLIFRRITSQGTDASKGGPSKTAVRGIRKRHPLIGALKGWIQIVPGTDLTQPADPEWGERAWGKKS